MLDLLLTAPLIYQRDNKNLCIENSIIGMRDGSKESLSEFYSLAKGSIYGFALSILKNKEDAEDILQDTLIKIYSSAKSYKANGNPMPWVLQITKNLALMKLREGRHLQLIEDDKWENIAFTEETADEEDRFFLHEVLSKLTDEERQIVLLHASSGLKHRETASLLGMRLSTVLSKYNRAIKKIQNSCERRQSDDRK